MAKLEIHQKRAQERTVDLIKSYTKQIMELQIRVADLERQLYGGQTSGSTPAPIMIMSKTNLDILPTGAQRSF